MKLLFLDTETSGLNPNSGQIIEIGAILTTLDTTSLKITIDSKFEDLIALRSQMDDRITRITGITSEELFVAKPIHKVQEKWFEFLRDCPENIVIIGHSLQFDLDFLKAESWFLPEKYIFCDSLDISKILLPTCNAVNLEYLVEKLKLEPQRNQLEQLGITDKTLLKHHRALYDTIACVNLVQNLFNILSKSNFDQVAYKTILEEFIPIDTSFFSKSISKHNISNEPKIDILQENKQKVSIHFDGSVIQDGLYDKINKPTSQIFIGKMVEYLKLSLPRNLKQIVLQIYVISVLNISNNKQSLKIHTKNATELLFANKIYDSIVSIDNLIDISHLTSIISPFEAIISQIKYVSEHNYKLSVFISLLEIYYDILKSEKSEDPLLVKIQEIIVCYDFLLLNLQQFWQKSEYFYTPNQLKPEEEIIRKKITEMYHLFSRFDPNMLKETNPITAQLKYSIIAEYLSFFDQSGKLQIAPSNKLLFRNQGMQISISTFVYQFNLNTIFEKTMNQYNSHILETYLKKEDFTALLKLTGLQKIIDEYSSKITVVYLNNPNCNIIFNDTKANVKLSDFLEERKEIVNLENKYSLLLCGQNSSLKEIERQFTQDYEPDEYFVLGESGSLTKVVSKMIKNQKSMVAIKNGDFYYLSRYLDLIEFAEIWIINQPYFPIHKYWQTLSLNSTDKDEYMHKLKWLYLKSQTGFISAKTGLDINFLKSYRVGQDELEQP
ncbi:MAG: 3'-5' exonuclease [candidate division SR1 bacterium]|nr:3'-5' exonuclease [candidate division SR1 bacterium]